MRMIPVSMSLGASADIPRGLVPGVTSINKFGRNTGVPNGTEEIWDGSATYVFPATALMTKLSGKVNQAGMTGKNVEVQGLDANWNLSTQVKALDSSNTTTAVTLATPLVRCFRMKVLADVVTDQAITVHNTANNQDYASITAGNNQTLMAIYTIAANKTAYITNYYATSNPGVGAPTALQVKLWASDRLNGYAKQLKHVLGLSADADAYGRFQHHFTPYLKLTQRTDVYLTATATGAVDVSAGFDLILEDN